MGKIKKGKKEIGEKKETDRKRKFPIGMLGSNTHTGVFRFGRKGQEMDGLD